jgi:uncharacterized protein
MAFLVPAQPTGFVNDYAGVMTGEERAALESKISNFEKGTTNEVAVVTIPSLDGDTIENVAQEIFTKWEVGKKDKNNGVLVLVSVGDHESRIHTGYGVEEYLTDVGTRYIQDEVMIPEFRSENYYAGINGGVDKIIEALGGNNIVPENYKTASKIPWQFIIFIIFIIIQFYLARKRKRGLFIFPWWWGGGGGFGGGGSRGGGFGGFGGGSSGGGGSSSSW